MCEGSKDSNRGSRGMFSSSMPHTHRGMAIVEIQSDLSYKVAEEVIGLGVVLDERRNNAAPLGARC